MEEIAQNLINKCPRTEEKSLFNNNNYSRSYASGANTTAREFRGRTGDQNQPPVVIVAGLRNPWVNLRVSLGYGCRLQLANPA